MARNLLNDNRLLGLLAACFFVLGVEPWGFLFSCAAWTAVFLIFLNSADNPRKVVHFLNWNLLAWYVYCIWASHWLLNLNVFFFFLTIHVLFFGFFVFQLLLRLMNCSGERPFRDAVLAGLLWALIGWIYGQTPFSGLVFLGPFLGSGPLLQIGSIIGFDVFSGIMVSMLFALTLFIKQRSRKGGILALILAGVVLGAAGWGLFRSPPAQKASDLKVVMVQHDLPFSFSWKRAHKREIQAKYHQLANEAAKADADLMIFPQYTIAGIDFSDPMFFSDIARSADQYVLFASHMPASEDPSLRSYHRHMNAGVLVNPGGAAVDHYQAIRAPMTEEGVVRSSKYDVIETPWGKMGLLLCYEDLYPDVTQKAVAAGAEFLVALSNPGQFVGKFLPRQHLMQDRLRAIESGRYLIRVTPNGYSAVIDPLGRVLKATPLRERSIFAANVPMEREQTIFHRIFYFIPAILILLIARMIFIKKR